MPKLGYSKSRNGCTRCRQRRVKCDEKRPCSACVRHKVTCSLMTAPPNPVQNGHQRPAQRPTATIVEYNPALPNIERKTATTHSPYSNSASADAASPVSVAQSPLQPNPSVTSPDPFPYFSKYVLPQHIGRQDAGAWATDLELMHHYSTATCFTFPRGNEVGHVWQSRIVESALEHEPLLHELLAITASHLAYLRPHRRQYYAMIASQHQSDAARGLRTALMHITPENCHASFGAASVLIIGAFAAAALPANSVSQAPISQQPTLQDMLDVIILTRGMNLVLRSSEVALHHGPFADLFVQTNHDTPQIFLEAVCGKLHELSIKILEDHSIDQETARVVNQEIHNLVTCIKDSIRKAHVPSLRIVTFWPTVLSDGFLALLHRKALPALAVFTYYCAVLHESQAHAWYLCGWGLSIGREIERYLQQPWLEAIRWPMGCMSLERGA